MGLGEGTIFQIQLIWKNIIYMAVLKDKKFLTII